MQAFPRISWRGPVVGALALAALYHGARFDFFCDDALIALRYSKNLLEHHELAYNLGQRVEGFTSPLWVFLLAFVGSFGSALPSAARLLGALASLGTFAALIALWDELEPKAPWLVLLPAAMLAACTPFAAWIFGGLETPLFVCTYTLTLALIARERRTRRQEDARLAGIVAGLCTLCRPEGMVLVALGTLSVALPAAKSQPSRWAPRLLAWGLPIVVLVGGYELFRLSYFGFPLPNTFYVKTSGTGLFERGLAYVEFAGREFGSAIVWAIALGAGFLLLPSPLQRRWREDGGSFGLVACATAASIIQLLYVARIGGDFLDLYRFLTPLLPVAFCILACAIGLLFAASRGPARWGVLLAAAVLAALYLNNQREMAEEARQVAPASRRALGLEPLGWTRLYGLRWRGIGEWLALVRQPGDSTAIGAAGSVPYYSGMPNLDLFGLNDLEIARHGRINGNRPGHQRFTTMEYLLAQRPTFIFMNPEATPLGSQRLRSDRYWASQGYLPIEIRVDRSLCDCPESFYHQFLVRRERAPSLQGREDTVTGS